MDCSWMLMVTPDVAPIQWFQCQASLAVDRIAVLWSTQPPKTVRLLQ